MTNGGYLTRQQIIDAKDQTFIEVPVPEWGGTLRVMVLGGREEGIYIKRLEAAEREFGSGAPKGNLPWSGAAFIATRVDLCALSIVDQHGNRMFDESEVEMLGRRSSVALGRVADVALKAWLEAKSAAGEESGAEDAPAESSSLPSGPVSASPVES